MAEKRMFSIKLIDTDLFLELPISSQNLYFHLGMRADDDGFVDKPKTIMKVVGAKEDDLKILIMKRFIIPFDNGLIVIRHWRLNNYLRSDRYNETKYLEEKSMLSIKENGEYELKNDVGIPSGLPNTINLNLNNNNSLDNTINLVENKEIKNKETKELKTTKKKYGKYQRILLSNDEFEKLCEEFGKEYIEMVIERIDEYVEENNNKNKYKNFNLVIRKAIRDNWSCLKDIKKEEPQLFDDSIF